MVSWLHFPRPGLEQNIVMGAWDRAECHFVAATKQKGKQKGQASNTPLEGLPSVSCASSWALWLSLQCLPLVPLWGIAGPDCNVCRYWKVSRFCLSSCDGWAPTTLDWGLLCIFPHINAVSTEIQGSPSRGTNGYFTLDGLVVVNMTFLFLSENLLGRLSVVL